jgi:hypothetical protein
MKKNLAVRGFFAYYDNKLSEVISCCVYAGQL